MDYKPLYNSLPQGWLDIEEALLLLMYARLTEGDILEVGVYRGRSTVLLASLDRIVHAVDPFEGFDTNDLTGKKIEEDFIENTKNHKKVILYKMKVEDWEPSDVGFVYLDGDHTYEGTRRQIEIALKCNPKYIAIHDIASTGDGIEIARAAKELLGDYELKAGRMAVWKIQK